MVHGGRPALGMLAPVLLILATLLAPAAAGAESVTQPYVGGGVRVADRGPTFIICGAGCDLDGDGEAEIPPLGGGDIVASQGYMNALVSTSDDVYGSAAGMRACFFDPENGEIIQEPYCSDYSCGVATLFGSPYASDRVSVFMIALFVSDALEVCGATAGTITADFF